nr:54s ribosomal protein l37, mitochondrial [Quercus suber]
MLRQMIRPSGTMDQERRHHAAMRNGNGCPISDGHLMRKQRKPYLFSLLYISDALGFGAQELRMDRLGRVGMKWVSAVESSLYTPLQLVASNCYGDGTGKFSCDGDPRDGKFPMGLRSEFGPLPPLSVPRKPSKAAAKLPTSSVRAGTVLKGLNFLKNKPDPVALEDREYPDWLWTVLEASKAKAEAGGSGSEGDLFAKSKKQRQKAAKAQRKQALLNPGALAPKVPLYEQSVDLPTGEGGLEDSLEAGAARRELTRAMRQKRKAAIKEDNFLRSMR